MIYDANITTRARNYDPVVGEGSSEGDLQRSDSAGEVLVGNNLFHRDQIINTDADSRQLNPGPAVSAYDTIGRADDKNLRSKNPGSETSVRRGRETKSDTHTPKTNQKRKSETNTAQECNDDAGARSQKPDEREETGRGGDKSRLTSDPIVAPDGKIMNYEQFKVQQIQDESLSDIWHKARVGHPRFFISDKGILFSKVENAGWEGHATGNVLVAPMACREQILNLAHTHLLGGHLGINKTRDRIRRQFWFPKFDQIISQYVNSCPQCQITARNEKKHRAPLIKVPVIEQPMSVITMDFVGPVAPTKSGKKYMLILVCEHSKYVEAIPMASMRAQLVCEKLVEFWSRFGISKEIRSDQGRSFVSELVTGLEKLVGCVPTIHSSYAHHTSGTAERAIQTLKHMMKKFMIDKPADWDKKLNYLLFSLREVKHATTGLSPNSLVYGRELRGPLEVLKEAWSSDEPPYAMKQNVVEYLLETRKRLEECADIAISNSNLARDRAKAWYDQYSTERSFKPDDAVLVLLPSSTDALKCTYQGPGKILKRLNDVSYVVAINNRISKLHVNLLRPWIDRSKIPNLAAVNVTLVANECEADYELLPGIDDDDVTGPPEISLHLNDQQTTQLTNLIQSFKDTVFSEKLGHTDLIQHVIKLKDENLASLNLSDCLTV